MYESELDLESDVYGSPPLDAGRIPISLPGSRGAAVHPRGCEAYADGTVVLEFANGSPSLMRGL